MNIVLAAADGYPYLLQEFGKALWANADRAPFTADGKPIIDRASDS
ncbi:hypothetical protein [Tomitella gaofuii]|nr:hypothetical protein [Tomitella gaofuii]